MIVIFLQTLQQYVFLTIAPPHQFNLDKLLYIKRNHSSHQTQVRQRERERDTEKRMETQIPFLDFTKDPKDLEEGSDGWKYLCDKVGEACQGYGCFQVAYNKVSRQLHEDMFKASKDLFDLPVETKEKNYNPKPHFGYLGNSDVVPLYESLGIEDAPILDDAQAFTQLMWPNGNVFFCQTLNTMSRKMLELELIVKKMVLESFGLVKYYESSIESSRTVLRVMKYQAPPRSPKGEDESAVIGLVPHTDKGILTILCQDKVQGLDVLTKRGHWVRVAPLPGTFTVFVGEAFKAWSNGRLHAAKHRVMMSGDKDRYSCALFAAPKEGAVVQVPEELVDKDHPLLFRPFNFMEFLQYFYSTLNNENALELYASV